MVARIGRITGVGVVWLACCGAALALPPFTSAPKTSASGGGQAEVFAVTAGCHATFDRVVVRTRFARAGYSVRSVAQVRAAGSGAVVPLPGSARLRIDVRDARGHTAGGVNLLPGVLNPGCSNLLRVRDAGDFEGIVTLGLGLRRAAAFRVFRLTGPRRVVVDVAH
jgi:hypothetical protein